jgi:hypothetical protein
MLSPLNLGLKERVHVNVDWDLHTVANSFKLTPNVRAKDGHQSYSAKDGHQSYSASSGELKQET